MEKYYFLGLEDYQQFLQKVLRKAGVAPEDAKALFDNTYWNDMVGRYNHGIWRIRTYLKRFKMGLIKSPSHFQIVKQNASTVLMDGNNGFGQALGTYAMQKAVQMAKETGLAAVGVKNSNHFGTCAYFNELAAREGMISIVTSNSISKVAPFGGKTRIFGTNPLGFGVPKPNGSILIDFASSATAGSTIIKARKLGTPIPEGILIDTEGNPVTDPNRLPQSVMLTFEGHKGYCIALMVEILSGVLTGAGMTTQTHSMFNDFDHPGNLGQFYLALDISKFIHLPDFYERIQILVNQIKQADPLDPQKPVKIPGEGRWRAWRRHLENGFRFDEDIKTELELLSEEYGVELPKFKPADESPPNDRGGPNG
ncbi:MAG: Ldh family oxidoreductase [Calditrichia bacterium]